MTEAQNYEFIRRNTRSSKFRHPRVRPGTPIYVYKTEDLQRVKDGLPGVLAFVHAIQTENAIKVYFPHNQSIRDNIRHKDDPIGNMLPTEWGFWDYTEDTKVLYECARKLGILKKEELNPIEASEEENAQ